MHEAFQVDFVSYVRAHRMGSNQNLTSVEF